MNRIDSSDMFSQCKWKCLFPLVLVGGVGGCSGVKSSDGSWQARLFFRVTSSLSSDEGLFLPLRQLKVFRKLLCTSPSVCSESLLCQNLHTAEQKPALNTLPASGHNSSISDQTCHLFLFLSLLPLIIGFFQGSLLVSLSFILMELQILQILKVLIFSGNSWFLSSSKIYFCMLYHFNGIQRMWPGNTFIHVAI